MNKMNESDCEDLMNSICNKLINLINDENIKFDLINDLKLINNSYKSIIEWKKKEILKLNNQLIDLKQQNISKRLYCNSNTITNKK